MKLVVTICTRERAEPLGRCLAALAADPQPAGMELAVVVVENEAAPRLGPMLAGIARSAPFALHHVHEPRLGIPMARNRAVEAALALDPDWIGFIDDDEEVLPGWLAAMAQAAHSLGADVIVGEVVPRIDGPRPAWMGRARPRRQKTGEQQMSAATNNTLARARLFRSDGLGLRFDERFRFSGGEDVALFGEATRQGARILWTADAPVEERWPPVRLTPGWHLRRVFSTQLVTERIVRTRDGRRAWLSSGPRNAFETLRGLGMLAVALLSWPVARRFAARSAFKGAKKLAAASAWAAVPWKIERNPYSRVDR